jgi:hypothetical protein
VDQGIREAGVCIHLVVLRFTAAFLVLIGRLGVA